MMLSLSMQTIILIAIIIVLLIFLIVLSTVLIVIKKRDNGNRQENRNGVMPRSESIKSVNRNDNHRETFVSLVGEATEHEQDKSAYYDVNRNIQQQAQSNTLILGMPNQNLNRDGLDNPASKYEQKNYDNVTASYSRLGKTAVFNISEQCTIIGRDSALCDIVLDDDTYVSKYHAAILERRGTFYLASLNSKNGTYINNQKIEGLVPLKGVTNVKIANVMIQVSVDV